MASGATPTPSDRFDFVFITSNFTWGGSEELWSEAAAALAERGHRVTVYKNRLKAGDGNLARLRALGCAMVELARFPLLPKQVFSLFSRVAYPLSVAFQALRLHLSLRMRRRPALVVISQGGNHDGWLHATVCRRLGLRYVLLCQKASDQYWPDDRWLPYVRSVYEGATHAFFVAEHNRRLTEEQIGAPLASASVVRNPFKVPFAAPQQWPPVDRGYRFACVGRLYPSEKGQDLLLRVLARDKWRRRAVSVTFYGTGNQSLSLEAMARHLELPNVSFAGHVDDIAGLWGEHHALVLPSRAEGLPLVVVEAMLSGRVVIVTDVGGNAEVFDDGVSGFLAAAPTEASLDEAMECAWQRREEWPQIALRAAAAIRALVPADPSNEFAGQLLRIAGGQLPSAEWEVLEQAAE